MIAVINITSLVLLITSLAVAAVAFFCAVLSAYMLLYGEDDNGRIGRYIGAAVAFGAFAFIGLLSLAYVRQLLLH